MIGRFGFGAGGTGGGVIFLVPLDGAAGAVAGVVAGVVAVDVLLVLLLPVGDEGAHAIHVHTSVINTRTGNNFLFIEL
jgi:hypothetical protein